MEESKLVYTAKEVSQLLRIHLMTVYKMVRRGDLPHFRVGKKILVPRHAIEALLGKSLDQKETAPSPEGGWQGRR